MASETVRIASDTHHKLKELSQKAGEPMTATLAAAVDILYRRRFLDECNAAFARLKLDETAWADEQEERKLWEATLADGLDEA